MNMEIASIIFEICIVLEPATTSGTGLLLDRDTGLEKNPSIFFSSGPSKRTYLIAVYRNHNTHSELVSLHNVVTFRLKHKYLFKKIDTSAMSELRQIIVSCIFCLLLRLHNGQF